MSDRVYSEDVRYLPVTPSPFMPPTISDPDADGPVNKVVRVEEEDPLARVKVVVVDSDDD